MNNFTYKINILLGSRVTLELSGSNYFSFTFQKTIQE